jgi:hypothetical protein
MRDWDGDDGLARDGEFTDFPFLARGEQVRVGVGEGRMALVEAGPILRVVWDFEFCIWLRVLKGENFFWLLWVTVSYRRLPLTLK